MFSNAPPNADTAALGRPVLYKTNPNWEPDLPVSPDLLWRRSNFEMSIRLLFANHKRNITTSSNLLPNQEAALKWLLDQNDISILNADKNLGPVVMESTKYIHLAYRDHLSDESTYRRLTRDEVDEKIRHTHQKIDFFLEANQKSLRKSDYNYISRCTVENKGNPSYMYLLAKIHKTPLKTRAIISSSGSLCSGIAKWLSVELKKIIRHMPYVATSSATVVKELQALDLTEHTRLFTMDAVSMYTNIHVGHALPVILEFLRSNNRGKQIVRREGINLSRLEYVLDLVMNNNVFQFGDTYWLQLAGTAMGTPPAPDYATLYYAIFELALIQRFPEIEYYRRYIDDGLGTWNKPLNTDIANDDSRFLLFKSEVNTFGIGHPFFSDDNPLQPLRWTFSERAKSAIFLDLDITVRANSIYTKIYEKELNLSLYIPPHSCHPPGCLKGLIYGFAVRAKNLCTDPADRMPFVIKSYHRLLARGYSASKIRPIFLSAISKVLGPNYTPCIKNRDANDLDPGNLYLHLKYNPSDPAPNELQSVFKNNIVEPAGRAHISNVHTFNKFEGKADFNAATVCYSSQKTLGNLLSPRKHRFGDLSVDDLFVTFANRQDED
jgi:hypothetical protein